MAIPCKKKGGGTCAAANINTPTTALFTGLIKMKTCKIFVEIVEMMVPFISKKFAMMAEVTTELLIHFSTYFEHTGIHNEGYLSFMTNYVNWPPPQTITTVK